MTPLRRAVLAIPALMACNSGTTVVVLVDSTSPLPNVELLRAHAAIGAQSRDFDVPLTTKAIPPTHTFAIDVPPSLAGTIDVHVDALDSQNAVVGSGDGSTTLAAGKRRDITIDVNAATRLDMSSAVPDMSNGPLDLYAPTWHVENAAMAVDLFGVGGSGPSDVYAVGAMGTILHRDASGKWTRQTSGVTSTLVRVWESPSGFVYVVGLDSTSNGLILFSTGLGNWNAQAVANGSGNPISVPALDGVSGTADNDISAVGGGGLFIHSGGGAGTLWHVSPTPGGVSNAIFGVSGGSNGKTYACGEAGFCAVSNGAGNWTAIPNSMTGTQTNLDSVSVTAAGDLYAAGGSGTIIHMKPTGVFSPENSHVTVELFGISASATAVFAVGQGGTIIASQGDGMWRDDSVHATDGGLPASDLISVWQAPSGDVFAVGKMGTILHRY